MTLHDLFSLSGKRALVTGSSRGIGRALALGLAKAGADVAVHGASSSAALDATVHEAGPQAIAAIADLAKPIAVQGLVRDLDMRWGGIDILVLNASIEIRQPYDKITPEAIAAQVAVNLAATQALITGFAPAMAGRGWGRILGIGSVQEVKEHPEMLIYAGLKAAQTSMMRNLARQLAPDGVTCNTLAPGAIETDRNAAVLADSVYRDRVQARIPMGRLGTTGDCVGAAIFLCSHAGDYITGERLLVDGGMHL